ncbi:hypothetical protein B0H19DRAFT_1085395 [Mycena capillaripes]|nr:hypothetical protein B0H19DRAFT_1085395 [Mycena capillaripes]
MNCQFSFGPNRSYFCSAGSIYTWSTKSLPPALARLLEDSAHPQALEIPYDVAFPMEPGTYAVCWKTKSGEDCTSNTLPPDGCLGPSYARLARFIKNVATKGAHTTRTVFGAHASFFSMSTSGYCYQNLPPELEDDIHSCMKLRRPVNVALGVQGSYVAMYNDGTVTFDLRGQYPLVEKMIRDTQEAARRRGVMYLALNPFIAGEYYAVYGDGSASWNFPTTWSANVAAISRQIKPVQIQAAPAPAVSPGSIPSKILPAAPVSPPPVAVSSGGTGPAPAPVPVPSLAPSHVSSVSQPSHVSMSIPVQVSSPVHVQIPPPAQAQTQTPVQVSSPVHVHIPPSAQAQTIPAPATSSGGTVSNIASAVGQALEFVVHEAAPPPPAYVPLAQAAPTSIAYPPQAMQQPPAAAHHIPAQPAPTQAHKINWQEGRGGIGKIVNALGGDQNQQQSQGQQQQSQGDSSFDFSSFGQIVNAFGGDQNQQQSQGQQQQSQGDSSFDFSSLGQIVNAFGGDQNQQQQSQGDNQTASFDFSGLSQIMDALGGDQNQQQNQDQQQGQQGDSSFDFSSLLQAANLDAPDFNQIMAVQDSGNF